MSNNDGIVIIDNSNASPYPSTNTVSGYVGVIESVLVNLNNVTHGYPDDLDIVLRAPSGKAVVLTSDAGAGFDLVNANLFFNPFILAAVPLPDEAQIISGNPYIPTSYPPADNYPNLPPGTDIVGGLNQLIDDDANGQWRLFVLDDTAVDAGTIGNWTLTFYMTPTISITNAGAAISITEDDDRDVTVFVNDTDTPLASLVMSATFDSALISSVTFSGAGTNRVATINPKANANTSTTGPTVVNLRVSDGSRTVSVPLTVTIDPVNDAATFVALEKTSTTIPLGGLSELIKIRIDDIDTDTNLLVLTATSSNNSIVSGTNVYFGSASPAPGTNRNMRIGSTGSAVGTATLTINVIDPSGATRLTNSTSFTVTVTNVAHTVAAKQGQIVATSLGAVSTNTVSGVQGTIGDVEVVLLDVEHTNPSELQVLLVGPGGQSVVLTRNAGGAAAATNIWLKLDDEAAGGITAPLATGTYDPTDNAPGSNIAGSGAAAPPASPYGANLSVFENTSPNGQWRLFVANSSGASSGELNGWMLHIYPKPTVTDIPTQTLVEGSVASTQGFVPFQPGATNSVTVTITVADQDGSVTNVAVEFVNPQPSTNTPTQVVAVGPVSRTLSAGTAGSPNTTTFTFSTMGDLNGTNQFRIIAMDNTGTAVESTGKFTATNYVNVVVTPVNDSPIQEVIEKQVLRAGQSAGPIPFNISDIESLPNDLTVTATSDNPKLLPQGSLVLGGSANARTLSIFPAGTQPGVANVTVRVTDPSGGSSASSFELTVLAPANPLFENNGVVAIPDNAEAVTSTNVVAGLVGLVTEVQVTLFNLTHPLPEDMDILLVGPTGVGIYLTSDAGGAGSVTNITVNFRDSGAPLTGQLDSGVWAPVNVNGPDSDFSPNPATTTVTSFAGFNNTNPNGNWRLFIRDDAVGPRGGSLGGGWQLSIRTRPSIAVIGTRTINEDGTARFSVAAGDNQPGVTYTISTTETPVAPTTTDIIETLTVVQNGGNLDFTIVPFANAFGTNSISVTVSDGTAPDPDDTETFTFIVLPIEDAPTITGLTDKTTPAATPISIPFTVSDPETADLSTIIIRQPTSADQSIVADANISVVNNGGGSRTLNIIPTGRAFGSTRITVQAVDGANQTNEVRFTLNVTENRGAFANTNPIPINDSPAGASISTLSVSGIEGRVSGVSVSLIGLTHGFPDDIDVLLVAPNGQTNVMLLSDAGGGAPGASNLRLTFQNGGAVVPDETALSSTIYDVANYNGADSEAGIAAGINQPYGTSMTAFENISNPNGTWALYVRDDTFSEAGNIAGGWVLVIRTAPTITQSINPVTTPEDTSITIPFTVRDSDTPGSGLGVTATINDTGTGFRNGLLVPASLTLTTSGNDRTLTILPVTNLWGTNEITLTVTDSNTPPTPSSTTFRVIVTPVNDAPVVNTVINTNRFETNEDVPITISYNVSDVDSTLRATNLVVVSSDNTTVSNNATAIVITGAEIINGSAVYTAQITPNPNRFGTIKLTATLRDPEGAQSVKEVNLDILAINDPPTFTTVIPNAQVEIGESTTNLVFRIADNETDERNLIISNIVSSNPSLIPTNNVIFSRTADSRLVQVSPVGTVVLSTEVDITVTISDLTGGTAVDTFTVTVTPPAGAVAVNTTPIIIPGAAGATVGPANLYPSPITIGGLIGPIHRVFVTLEGLGHENPDDLDILLVSPSGKKVMLMSDAGGTTDIDNLRVQFRDNGRALPDEGVILGGTNLYAASNYEGVGEVNENLPSPAPAAPYLNTLAGLRDDTTPNGNWSLYVADDTGSHTGRVSFGWTLRVVTGPSVGTLTATPASINEDTTSTLTFNVQDPSLTNASSLSVSFDSGNSTLFPTGPANIQFVNATGTPDAGGVTYTYTVVPGTNQFGTNTITAVITRTDGAVSRSAPVTIAVANVNDTAFISRLSDRTTTEDDAIFIDIQILDPDTARSNLRVVAESATDSVITDTNLVLTFSTSTTPPATSANGRILNNLSAGDVIRLWLIPNQDQIGSSVIRVNVGEISSASSTALNNSTFSEFTFTVTPDNDPPVIGTITNVTVVAGEVGSTTFTVTDPESNTITVGGFSSSNTNVVRNGDITVSSPAAGQQRIQVITQPGVNESTVISFTVSDGVNPAIARQFTVTSVRSREVVFANSAAITINDAAVNGGRAAPYPSSITVSGFVGAVSKVVVTLDGFNHTFPDDVDVLLVGPSGHKVILMSDAGGSTASSSSIVLRFDPTSGTPIPDTSLAAGTYRPANYEGVETFPDAPAGAISSDATGLTAFNGIDPNGVWSLYILDDTASDSGNIVRGWALGITTQPVITSLPDITIEEDTRGTNRITIAEESFAGTTFNFGFSSTNVTLLPANRITTEGSGLSRSIIVDPLPNQVGQTEVTVLVTNQNGQVVSDKFIVVVTPVNDRPVIVSDLDDVERMFSGGSIQARFEYSDVETDRKDLIVTIESGTPSVIPVNNVQIVGTNIVIFSEGSTTGSSQISITVSDGQLSTNKVIRVIVDPALNPQFSNTSDMVVPEQGTANLYPSTIAVSDVSGLISRVIVTLTDMTHPFPDDFDIALVGPNGKKVVLMSDAGGGGSTNAALNRARLTFDDLAAVQLPDDTEITNKFGTYKPTDYVANDVFPAPAPAVANSGTLAAGFAGISPNGTWSLYVLDDQAPDGGLVGGWIISFVTTAPTVDFIPNQTFNEDFGTNVVNFTVGDDSDPANLIVRVTSSDTTVVNARIVGAGASRGVQLESVSNASGTATITITVQDESNTVNRTFEVTVVPVNDAPVITGLANASTPANVALTIPFTVTDVESQASVVVSISNSNTDVSTAVLNGSNGSYSLTIVPQGIFPTNTTITVTATDGTVTTINNVVVTITEPLGPDLSDIPDQLGTEDTALQVPFTVAQSGATPANVTATASNTNLVFSASISGSGTSRSVVILLVPNAFGTSTITVTATDDFGTDSDTFELTVPNTPDAPSIGAIGDRFAQEDAIIDIPLAVTDSDTALADLVFTASTSNSNLVSSVTFSVSGGVAIARVNLVPDASGVAAISISVSDGAGSAASAFALTVTGVNDAPVLGPISSVTVQEDDQVAVPLNITDSDTAFNSLTITGTSSNSGLVQSITFATTASNASALISLVPNQFGNATITIEVREGTNVSSQSFGLTVLEVTEDPIFPPIANVTTNENAVVTIPLNISDPDDALANLTFFSTVEGTTLVQSIQFIFPTPTSVSAVITLKTNAGGVTERITLSVSDGNAVIRQSFNLTVNAVNDPPQIAPIGDQTVTGGPVEVSITVTDPDSDINELFFSGSAATTNLASSIGFAVTGPNTVRATINLIAGRTGTDRITISVSDGESNTRSSFNLTVSGTVVGPSSLSIARGTGNNIIITVTGTVGATYAIEGTANFTAWSAAGSVTIGAGGTGTITIPSGDHHRFFRARSGGADPVAQPLAYEGFDYPAGTQFTTNLTGGTGWAAGWTPDVEGPASGHVIVASSLAYTDGTGKQLVTSGNKSFYTAATASGDIRAFRTISGAPRTNGTTWLSFMGVRMGPTTNNTATPNNIYPRGTSLAFYLDGTEKFGVGNASGAVSNLWSLFFNGSGANINNDSRAPVAFSQLSLIVVRVEHLGSATNPDNVYMWVNPPLGAEPSPATASARSVGLFDASFNRFRPFVGAHDAGNARPYGELEIDEIRVGDSFASVTPFTE